MDLRDLPALSFGAPTFQEPIRTFTEPGIARQRVQGKTADVYSGGYFWVACHEPGHNFLA
ncbi:hypothetical protein [Bradyrhizobium sp. Rc3b]|uniref:hypothetical protein n=1 Tax=Bradyrhizobium sp. Rc3b TaxID=1855322 RepID=UPI0011603809|nr:hypothetical protein [Bradyrhizobium sp. Rc3b]